MKEGRHAAVLSRAAKLGLLLLLQHACVLWTVTEARTFTMIKNYTGKKALMRDEGMQMLAVRSEKGEMYVHYTHRDDGLLYTSKVGDEGWGEPESGAYARCLIATPENGILWYTHHEEHKLTVLAPKSDEGKFVEAEVDGKKVEVSFDFCADHGGDAYFFDTVNHKLFKAPIAEMETNKSTLSLVEVMELPASGGFILGVQHPSGASNPDYLVDLACVAEYADADRCVQQWDSTNATRTTVLLNDLVYTWNDTRLKAYRPRSANTVSPYLFNDRTYEVCALDPLLAHFFCTDGTDLDRIRVSDLSVVDRVTGVTGMWNGSQEDYRQMAVGYAGETAAVCVYSVAGSNGCVSCSTFAVSDCSVEGAACFDDAAYCRFDLDTGACRSVQTCTDAARCLSRPVNATLASSSTAAVGASASRIVLSLERALTLGSGISTALECRFASGLTTPATMRDAQTVECAVPSQASAGAYEVVLVATGAGAGLALTRSVALTLYDCRAFTDCATCVADGRACAWAYAASTCVPADEADATSVLQEDACPVLGAPAPATLPQLGAATTVVVPAANVRTGHVSCVFTCDEEGSAGANVTAEATCAGALCRCRYHTSTGFGPDRCHLTLRLYHADMADAQHHPIATAAGTIEARKCAALSSCAECNAVSLCRWVVGFNSEGTTATFSAGCVTKENTGSWTVVEKCPAVVGYDTHVDMLSEAGTPLVHVTLAGTDHPESMLCVYDDDVATASTARTVRGDRVEYACVVPESVHESTTMSLALAVPSLAEGGTRATYAAAGPVHLLFCARHRQCAACAAEHSECGFVYSTTRGSSSSVCTWKGNAKGGAQTMWSRTCFQSAALAPRTLNAAGGRVVLGTGACPAFLDGRYNCTLARTGDGHVYQSVPLTCHNATTAACTFGPSVDEDGSIAWRSSVTVAIVKAAASTELSATEMNVREEDGSASEGEEEDPLAEFTALTWTTTMLNCLSDTSDCATCTGTELATRTQGGCAWSLSEARCVVSESGDTAQPTATEGGECPTLRTVPKEVTTRTKTFSVYGTNFRADVPVALVLVGADSNASCAAAVVAPTELRVSECRGLPAAPTELHAVLVVAASGHAYAAGAPALALVRAPFPLWAIIVIAVVLLALLAAAVAFAAVYARTHGGLRPYRFDVSRMPDFEPFRWATDLRPSGSGASGNDGSSNADRDSQLRKLLQDERVRVAVCRATAATEADRFASAMVYASAADGRAADLVLALVRDEVQSVPSETQLFRGNSLASKAFRAYSRMVGLEYLWHTLARFVHELSHLADVQDRAERRQKRKSDSNVELEEASGMHDSTTTTTTTTTSNGGGPSILSTEFEVDPTKLGAGADEEAQAYMLAQRARQLVLCITQSTAHMPAALRGVAHRLAEAVGARFPGCEHIAIGGTFFLRFLCPALLAPHCYALLMTPDRRRPVTPSARLQRQLVLLGKVLQNLANGVLFGKKEPFMVRMNHFIARNLPAVGQWMDDISSGAAPASEAPVDVPRATLADSLLFLRTHVAANLPKIQANLQQDGAPPELFDSLRSLVQS